jgi:phage-related protein
VRGTCGGWSKSAGDGCSQELDTWEVGLHQMSGNPIVIEYFLSRFNGDSANRGEDEENWYQLRG